MHPSVHAKTSPDKPAIFMGSTGAVVTYRQLDAQSNQAAQLFRSLGLRTGDVIALCMDNCPEFLASAWGAQRSGLYYTCISTRLTPGEVSYILKDSGAKLFLTTGNLATLAQAAASQCEGLSCFVAGGTIPGFQSWNDALEPMPAVPVPDETSGADMLYSSGTTGRPKGVRHPLSGAPITEAGPLLLLVQHLFGISGNDIYLSPAPLYHAAPLRYVMAMHRLGGTTVIMEHFDAEQALSFIERYRVTASQWVPTMFVRMLKLPEAARLKYDLTSHRSAIHAAAPCPVEVKRQMIGTFSKQWVEPMAQVRNESAASE